MSANSAQEHAGSSVRLYAWVWTWLLALTGIEVYLGYVNLGTNLMLTLLLGLSVIKAVLIIAYFMHLRFDPPVLTQMFGIGLVLATAIMIGLLSLFWNDATDAVANAGLALF